MQNISDASLQAKIIQVAETLNKKHLMLATAESCTGGWVAKCCTDLAGSSSWFERGFVTYSNQAKHEQLGVKLASLDQYGAVSQLVAEEMAIGTLRHSKADISVSLTGIAGPGGGTENKPVGTVWIAWASQRDKVSSQLFQFDGDRESVRRQAVLAALSGIIKNARD
ncbi:MULTISPECIES: CinA family protein [Methylophaga]|jgi:nicotinamide-nucleotide amidase|uniref:Nicotinamide-nucleotide amidase n=1 Tax=Methylophaga marina TaxID=45495 RepID=A0ABN0TDK8_9GAMM|nr:MULTISPECIES: nicotinamide-nucleotide amidohydrolase family protein [Methylophaga]BDZ72583.1 nicotinamide-nucleotide amidohydrolase PncC [Methylophaga marina]|tara:strand:+ start:10708 stop:11208 length:501 start_codon:yes stop_codon:yes gene_type:complete